MPIASNADSHVCKLCTLYIQLELNFLKMASKFSSTSPFILISIRLPCPDPGGLSTPIPTQQLYNSTLVPILLLPS